MYCYRPFRNDDLNVTKKNKNKKMVRFCFSTLHFRKRKTNLILRKWSSKWMRKCCEVTRRLRYMVVVVVLLCSSKLNTVLEQNLKIWFRNILLLLILQKSLHTKKLFKNTVIPCLQWLCIKFLLTLQLQHAKQADSHIEKFKFFS